MSLIEHSFRVNTTLSKMAVVQLKRLNGLKTNIYYPIDKPSLYNDSSQSYVYNSSPDDDGTFLFTGIFGQDALTGLELVGYSSFNDGDGKMYVVGNDYEIPRNSKLEIFYASGMKVMRTQDLHIVNGIDGKPVYGIFEIVPIA